jgi:ABC-type uncharacterized transport system permease subunit
MPANNYNLFFVVYLFFIIFIIIMLIYCIYNSIEKEDNYKQENLKYMKEISLSLKELSKRD